jgi:signal transduction histidine kinase
MSSLNSIESIKSNNLFKNKDFSSLNLPFDPKNFVEIKEGDLIYKSGEETRFVYLLVKGIVKVKNSLSRKILTKSANDYFGDVEIINDSQRQSTAMANSDCVIYKLDGTIFKEIINNSESMESDNKDKESNAFIPKSAKKGSDFSDTPIISNAVKLNIDRKKNQIEAEKDTAPIADSFSENIIDTDKKELTNNTIIENGDVNVNIKQENKFEDDYHREVLEITNSKTYKLVEDENIESEWTKYEDLLTPSSDFNKTIKDILHFLLKQTDSDVGAIYFYNSEEDVLEDLYQTTESFYKSKKSFKNSLTGLTVQDKKINFVASYQNDPNYNAEIDLPNGFTGKIIIYIPLVDNDHNLLSVVQIGSNRTDFSKDEKRTIESSVIYCSIVLQKSLSFAKPAEETKQESDFKLLANFILSDIKAPLANIKNYSAILSKYNLPDEVKKVITLISAQSISIIDLIQSLVDYFENNNNVNVEETNFNDSLNQILTLLSDYVESRNVKLFKKFTDDAKVTIDIPKFYIASYYISKFACDMMREGGKLYYSSYKEDQNIVLKIKDESKGIANDVSDKIFDVVYSDNSKEKTGLGLAIARHLIESMNAKLKIESSETGISYLIFLPLMTN